MTILLAHNRLRLFVVEQEEQGTSLRIKGGTLTRNLGLDDLDLLGKATRYYSGTGTNETFAATHNETEQELLSRQL
ncbi:hypothetical protein XANCAGTX0491_006578 [Xanthoria calcicola]